MRKNKFDCGLLERKLQDGERKSQNDIRHGRFKILAVDSNEINVNQIRTSLELEQDSFAQLLGTSVRTIQSWEQGRRKPSGAALTLLFIAKLRPDAIWDVCNHRLGEFMESRKEGPQE